MITLTPTFFQYSLLLLSYPENRILPRAKFYEFSENNDII